ncbi:uncharacterized protein [Aristolochia californica]|uniref:uncharacterized protein n=1 Tax=Aristolochia californica TaxID=171875 RepID=UPI0035E0419E
MVAAGVTKVCPAKKLMAVESLIQDGKQFKSRASPNRRIVFPGNNVREKNIQFHGSTNLDHRNSLKNSPKPLQYLPTRPCEQNKKFEAVQKLKGKLAIQSLQPSIGREEEKLVKEVSAKEGNFRTGDSSNGIDKEVEHEKEISCGRLVLQTGHLSVVASETRPSYIRLRSHGPLPNVEENKLKIPQFSISLTALEIEQDFLAMTGEKTPRKPQTRPKLVQKKLNETFPGQWLQAVTLDSYNVDDPAKSMKR